MTQYLAVDDETGEVAGCVVTNGHPDFSGAHLNERRRYVVYSAPLALVDVIEPTKTDDKAPPPAAGREKAK